ncbi:cytidylyltransferase [Histoplasma capsulatum]|uniref:Cytidylyltransferase n=1 Tax=Ajellomyces capsulatus TaxID=5037 RepID=A0A8A1MB05_AJECA|nr:conserved hypothetical protein [Histoplasma mississippiense (nom. inval.)]EDN09071.1 conserved hypothetical protein [Histoplasma mississippiense (nom. inval.)]QSS63676.1 cytidylyltransferase [Histoplasma capsulatum]
MTTKFQVRSLHHLRQTYHASVQNFISSSDVFHILDTVPVSKPQAGRPAKLYVLDSSFNPPTRAHLSIAKSALLRHDNTSSVRLLLLLATQNADKASKPASCEDRLVMMRIFAEDIQSALEQVSVHSDNVQGNQQRAPTVDIGITKLPYFIDKAAAISTSNFYPGSPEQILLTGYDTLERIFDCKYYPPEHTLQPLSQFFAQHRLRVTFRPDSEWGGRKDQELFLQNLAQGARESDGGKREWAQRIELVEGAKTGEEDMSSTKARNAAVSNDVNALEKFVTPDICDWVVSQRLYGSS